MRINLIIYLYEKGGNGKEDRIEKKNSYLIRLKSMHETLQFSGLSSMQRGAFKGLTH